MTAFGPFMLSVCGESEMQSPSLFPKILSILPVVTAQNLVSINEQSTNL